MRNITTDDGVIISDKNTEYYFSIFTDMFIFWDNIYEVDAVILQKYLIRFLRVIIHY